MAVTVIAAAYGKRRRAIVFSRLTWFRFGKCGQNMMREYLLRIWQCRNAETDTFRNRCADRGRRGLHRRVCGIGFPRRADSARGAQAPAAQQQKFTLDCAVALWTVAIKPDKVTHIIDPVVPGSDDTVMQTLYDEFPDERRVLYELYRGAFAQNLSLAVGTLIGDPSPAQ